MPCSGCAKRRAAEQARREERAAKAAQYELVSPTGAKSLHRTEAAAKAANARNGNRGTVSKIK